MPSWIPRQQSIQEQLADEVAKQEALRFVQQSQRETPAWTPLLTEPINNVPIQANPTVKKRLTVATPAIDPAISVRPTPQFTPIQQEIISYMPAEYQQQSPIEQPASTAPVMQRQYAQPQPVQTPIVTPPVNKTQVKPAAPFWQRALQVFSAPFNWIDEYIIKPALSVPGTALGIVPESKRKPGEDFFDWKRRSWSEWQSPGVDINVPWSDKPWRVDIKGVAEFAPWLLIPGAGQIGGGISGLGKVGFKATMKALGSAVAGGELKTASRIALGATISYSPWGIAEKTAGAVIKGTLKASAAVSTKLEAKMFGNIQPKPVTPAVQKLTNWFKEEVNTQFEKVRENMPAYRKEMASLAQSAKEQANKLLREGKITVQQANEMERQALAGGLKQKFPIHSPFTDQNEIDELLLMARKADETGAVRGIYGEINASRTMEELLLNHEIPQPKQLKALKEIYGDEFANVVGDLKGVKPSTLDKIWDIANIPRAVMASGDLSGTFRQGLILTLLHPIEGIKAFGKQLKAFASEKIAGELDDTLHAHKLYNFATKEMNVDFTSFKKGVIRGAKEEMFNSPLAEALPFVRRSERAYTTYLNQMKMAAVEKAYATMTSQGATKEQFKLLGGFINIAAGRGKLPFNLEKYSPMLNAVLFSPKYQMSILQLPGQIGKMLISKNPYVRREGGMALVTFLGGGAGLIALLQATGVGKVELDPRSSDFAKLKIGETRVDIWRGYAQYVRFINQVVLAQRKSSSGMISNAERGEIASRFVQTKLSPFAGIFTDLWKNETFQGEPIFTDTKGFSKVAKDRLFPLAVQDVWDAMEMNGVNGLWTAAPATLGIGVMTYVNDYVKAKNKVAKENGYESWDAIDPKTQLEIERNSPELQAAEIAYDRQTMGTAWGDWHLAGKAVEDVFRENVDLAVAQFKETGDGVQFRKKIGKAYDEKKGGYSAREKESRFADIVDRLNTQDPAQAMVTLGPEQMAIKAYKDALYGDDMYDQFGDYRYDEADIRKQQLHDAMGDKMFKYVEDYTGEKTADLPPEFQELKKAKIVMRPYWEVADKVERLFGKRFAESPKGQAMIRTQHKRLRATRPEIAKYYQLFYANQ